MKVILQEDVKKVGVKGDVVEVSDGYGRNFLLPKKLAKVKRVRLSRKLTKQNFLPRNLKKSVLKFR